MIYAVVPAHRPRLADLADMARCLELPNEDIRLLVVTTEPEPIRPGDLPFDFDIVPTGSAEVNFAKWYNLGTAAAVERGASEVLWMETDLRLDRSAVLAMRDALADGYILVAPDYYGRAPMGTVKAERHSWQDRAVCGTMQRASTVEALRADERFAWWYEMDDVEYRARRMGRVGIVGDAKAPMRAHIWYDMVRGADPERVAMARAGRRLFRERWGEDPFPFPFPE